MQVSRAGPDFQAQRHITSFGTAVQDPPLEEASTVETSPVENSTSINGNGEKALGLKEATNFIFNGGAAALNLVVFISGILGVGANDSLENASNIFTRMATGIQGILLAVDTWKTRNLIPFIGSLTEIPIAFMKDDYNRWGLRGFPQGTSQFYPVIDRREVTDENGDVVYHDIKDSNGRTLSVPKTIGANFKKPKGAKSDTWGEFKQSAKVLGREYKKMGKELVKNPANIFKMSFGLALVSTIQSIGGLLMAIGFTTVGSWLRNFGGAGVDFTLVTDKKPLDSLTPKELAKLHVDDENKAIQGKGGFDLNSLNVWAGFVWIGAAVFDQAKRSTNLEDSVPNLTNLSLASDRGASVLYMLENMKIAKERRAQEAREHAAAMHASA